MVFAFFKDTLKYLQKRLKEEGISIMLITGDTKHNERPSLIEKFRTDSSIEILLSSRVGSEGLAITEPKRKFRALGYINDSDLFTDGSKDKKRGDKGFI